MGRRGCLEMNSTEYDHDLELVDQSGKEGPETHYVGFELPLLATVCVLGYGGNIATLLVYTKPKYRRSNAAMYILSLAGGDILALFVVVFHITEFFPSTWPVLWAHDWQCMVHRYFRFVAFNTTVLTMTAIAVDRFYAVKHPVTFKVRFTVKRTRVVAAVLWVVAAGGAIPTAFMFQSIYGGSSRAVTYPGKIPFACKLVHPFGLWFKHFKAFYLNVVLFYLPVVVTAALYVQIVLYVWHNNAFVSRQMGRVPHRNSHWKTAKTLLTVFLVYVACYIILITYNLLAPYAPNLLPPELKNIGLLLPYVNSCMNPIVYSFTNPNFRKTCRDIFWTRKQHTRSETITDVIKENENNSSADDQRAKASNEEMPKIPSTFVSVILEGDTAGTQQNIEQRDSNMAMPPVKPSDTYF